MAVAEINCELSKFVFWFSKAKKKPSITKLILTGMPEGRGKKGGKSVKQKKKNQPTESRTSIAVLSGVASCTSTQGQLEPLLQQVTAVSSSLQLPSHPPPLVHYTPHAQGPSSSEPFVLCFIAGNIGICYGCRQKPI